jgi:hypothetical protein
MCVYEKGGTKQWRELQCNAINGIAASTKPDWVNISSCFTQHNTMLPGSQRAVFLRDPLDRFLSGFLDKCAGKHRLNEKHCKPFSVFLNPETSLVKDFLLDTRKFFEIYVDAMPLAWDLHFMPQSLNCDGLYGTLKDYDFVGTMGGAFYHDLKRFADQYPPLKSYVEHQFHLEDKVDVNNNQGVETKAASKTQYYYTPKTVRRVLEYMSVDYVMLNLPIPEWAEEMLANADTDIL